MDNDAELLRRFADEGTQEAFAELVRCKVDLVYAAALRQTDGDAHLAQDVTQGVFLALAQRAATLKRHPVLTGWLYTATRFVAVKAVRTQARWQRREQEANAMTTLSREPEPAWEELRPVIDEAMYELGETDRTALLLRFFEGRSLAEIGAAIGLAENSARMRVERALEKLRERLARRGITSTAAALGVALAAQPTVAAPVGTVTAAVKAALAASKATVLLGTGFFSGKQIAVGGLAALLGLGVFLTADRRLDVRIAAAVAVQERDLAEARAANRELRVQAAQVAAKRAAPAADGLARLRAIAALSRSREIGRVRWTRVENAAPFITPKMVELLALTPAEAGALQQAVDETRREMAELGVAGAIVQRSEHEIVVDVQPDGALRERYRRLVDEFKARLGAERFMNFEDVGMLEGLDSSFYNFGRLSTKYIVRRNPARPEAPYEASIRGNTGGKLGPLEEIKPAGGLDRTALREKLGAMDRLVPADF